MNKNEGSDGIEYHNVNIMGDVYRPFYYLNADTVLYNQVLKIWFHSQVQKPARRKKECIMSGIGEDRNEIKFRRCEE